jgi:hypothetical protein
MEEQDIQQDTSGFYKRDPGGILLFGKYYVLNANYFLKREEHDQHEYPIDGWSWYESEAEARENLGFPPADEKNAEALANIPD